ncbi:hypothetical protein KJ761_00720, partial [Patescibacteria group bacterium]|nr:hypothetical protein [Patescibacteria group bacterium]
VSISGLDGSGKSTQIKMLRSHLESRGKKVFYFHAIQFSLANKLSGKDNDKNTRSIIKANFFQIIGRRIFLLIDLLRFKMLRSKLRSTGYDYILSDRYFYDSVVNIEYLNNSSLPLEKARFAESRRGELKRDLKDYKSPPTPLLQRGILAPDIALYLKTSPEIIMQREKKPDQGMKYLQTKKVLYDEMAPVWNLKIIDGNRTQEEIFEEIRKLI